MYICMNEFSKESFFANCSYECYNEKKIQLIR